MTCFLIQPDAHWDDLVLCLTNEILRRSTELFVEFFFWTLSEDVVEIDSIGVLP